MLNAERRKKRLIELIERLKAKRTVTKRDLRIVLTDDEFENYEYAWKSAKELDSMLRETPDDLQGYLALLRRADALTTRGESMYYKGELGRYTKLARKADAAYERAYEELAETAFTDASSLIYLDREFNFTTDDMPDLTAQDAPRLLSGRSQWKQGGGLTKTKIRDLKLTTLEEALAELTTEDAPKLKSGQTSNKQNSSLTKTSGPTLNTPDRDQHFKELVQKVLNELPKKND